MEAKVVDALSFDIRDINSFQKRILITLRLLIKWQWLGTK